MELRDKPRMKSGFKLAFQKTEFDMELCDERKQHSSLPSQKNRRWIKQSPRYLESPGKIKNPLETAQQGLLWHTWREKPKK